MSADRVPRSLPLLPILMVVLLVAAPLRGMGAGSAVPDSTLRILVPAYFDPAGSEEWELLIAEAAALPGRVCAIVDPADGPGAARDSAYIRVIARMNANTGRVIGYVYTNYAAIPLATVKADIDTWYSYYPALDGIFLDCQAYDAGHEAYYVELYSYIKAKDSAALVVSNPGINTREGYLVYNGQRASDVICINESGTGFDSWTPASWCSKYADSSFYVLPYNTAWSDYPARVQRAVSLHIGWIYVTDGTMPNPWSGLPPYFAAFCHYLRTGEILPPPTGSTAITINGHFADWSGVTPLNVSTGFPPGSSPEADARYVNVWATNDTTNLYLSYQVAGTLNPAGYFYHIFLDVNNDAPGAIAGYRYNDSAAVGAEFMVEGNYFYRYTGAGGSAWSWSAATGMIKSDSTDRTELRIPLSVLFAGRPRTGVRLFLQSNAAASPYTLMCLAPADYGNVAYAYTLGGLTAVPRTSAPGVAAFALHQNYPNPFNPMTTLEYTIASPGARDVRLAIYDLLGREVKTLVSGYQSPGTHTVPFDGSALASGAYFCRLSVGGATAVRVMNLVR